jgi:hypothetical protein
MMNSKRTFELNLLHNRQFLKYIWDFTIHIFIYATALYDLKTLLRLEQLYNVHRKSTF